MVETQLEYQVSKENSQQHRNSQQQYSLSTMGTRALKENRADLEEKTNSLPEVSTEINKQSTRYQHINPLKIAQLSLTLMLPNQINLGQTGSNEAHSIRTKTNPDSAI